MNALLTLCDDNIFLTASKFYMHQKNKMQLTNFTTLLPDFACSKNA